MIESIGQHTNIKTNALLSATKQDHKIEYEYKGKGLSGHKIYKLNGFTFNNRKELNVYLLRLANILNDDNQERRINIIELLQTKDSRGYDCFKIISN